MILFTDTRFLIFGSKGKKEKDKNKKRSLISIIAVVSPRAVQYKQVQNKKHTTGKVPASLITFGFFEVIIDLFKVLVGDDANVFLCRCLVTKKVPCKR